MGWFNRSQQGINTDTKDKKEIKDGLWYKCPQCKEILTTDDHRENLCVCPKCGYKFEIQPEPVIVPREVPDKAE